MSKSFRRVRSIETDIFGLPIQEGGINSKAKGDKNELVTAVFLLRWTGEKFARVPRSGGLRWKNSKRVCGDLVCENDDFEFAFSIETKHLKKLSLRGRFGARSAVITIWEQCLYDAERSGRAPMLLLRENGMPKGQYVVYVDAQLAAKAISPLHYVATCHSRCRYDIVGIESEVFLENVDYNVLKQYCGLPL